MNWARPILVNMIAKQPSIQSISAVTLPTRDMAASVHFYQALGLDLLHGGDDAAFTSFRAGSGYLNLAASEARGPERWPGRVIFHVADVDALYRQAVAQGFEPGTAPRDAEWGERYFHILDPDGHELSFARPLDPLPSS